MPIAGALNLIGAEALYGRYWGALEDVPHLHFELCYYQAIDAAIARGLQPGRGGRAGRAQAGARLPAGADLLRPLYRRSGLPRAVADYLAAERRAVAREIAALEEMTPFRKG